MKNIKNIKYVLAASFIMISAWGCNDVDFDYELPTKIEFSTDDIIQIPGGTTNYTVKGTIKSTVGILEYIAYNANPRTGNTTTEIERVLFDEEDHVTEYSFSVELTDIEKNTCVKIYARDKNGEYMKGFMVKITPTVIFTDRQKAETGDYFYGSFFAAWHLGRVYPLREAGAYANAIDLSFGELTDPDTGISAPVMISPDKRSGYGMTAYNGARATKFAATDISMAGYNAIKEVDDTPLLDLQPGSDYEVLFANKVYAFETADGKKGLAAIYSLDKGAQVYTLEISVKVQK